MMATPTQLPSYSDVNLTFIEAQTHDPPPPYMTSQNQSEKIFLVQQQEAVCEEQPTQAYTRRKFVYQINDYRASSIVICVLCVLFGSPLTLLFSVPSVLYSFRAVKLAKRGIYESTVSCEKKSLLFSTLAFLTGLVVFVLTITLVSASS